MTVAPATNSATLTASERVRKEVELLIEHRAEISMPEIADELVDRFAETDAQLIMDLGSEKLRAVVYDIVQRTVACTREIDYIAAGTQLIPREQFGDYANRQTRRVFERWIENVGRGRSVQFLAMTAADLDTAIDERSKIVEHHSAVVALMKRVRQKVGQDQVVGDVFSPQQLEDLYEKIKAKTRGV